MGTLYIDRNNLSLQFDQQTLVIYENECLLNRIPLIAIDRIFIYGDTNINSKLINKLAENKIGLIFIGGRTKEPRMFFNSPHNDAKIRLSQYHLHLDPDFRIKFSQALIKDKITTQLELIQNFRLKINTDYTKYTEKFKQLEQLLASLNYATSINSIMGYEGAASSIYFDCIKNILPLDLRFKSRNRRPPKDPFNSIISLGYTLLHSEAVLEIYSRGLDPFIGFMHEIDYSRESLACDIIEPLRYIIDKLALDLFLEFKLDESLFSIQANGACWMNKTARGIFFKAYQDIQDKIHFQLNHHLNDVREIVKAYG